MRAGFLVFVVLGRFSWSFLLASIPDRVVLRALSLSGTILRILRELRLRIVRLHPLAPQFINCSWFLFIILVWWVIFRNVGPPATRFTPNFPVGGATCRTRVLVPPPPQRARHQGTALITFHNNLCPAVSIHALVHHSKCFIDCFVLCSIHNFGWQQQQLQQPLQPLPHRALYGGPHPLLPHI